MTDLGPHASEYQVSRRDGRTGDYYSQDNMYTINNKHGSFLTNQLTATYLSTNVIRQ